MIFLYRRFATKKGNIDDFFLNLLLSGFKIEYLQTSKKNKKSKGIKYFKRFFNIITIIHKKIIHEKIENLFNLIYIL